MSAHDTQQQRINVTIPDPKKMLADLALSGHTPSMIRRLQDYLPAIEQAVEAGYSLPAIHEWLVAAGIDMSLKYFRSALARLKKPESALV
jgi:hypothetical protein